MSKLPKLSPQQVIKILEKQGVALDRVRGSHHVYYNEISKKRVIVPPTLFI